MPAVRRRDNELVDRTHLIQHPVIVFSFRPLRFLVFWIRRGTCPPGFHPQPILLILPFYDVLGQCNDIVADAAHGRGEHGESHVSWQGERSNLTHLVHHLLQFMLSHWLSPLAYVQKLLHGPLVYL